MGRYMSRIKDGEVYKKALDNYQDYLKTKGTNDRRISGGTTTRKVELKTVSVQPFGFEGKYNVRTSAKGYDGLKAILAARVGDIDAKALNDRRFSPATLTGFASDKRAEALVKSKRTGLHYIKYGDDGDALTCAFGADAGSKTEEFEEGRNKVIAAFRAANSAKTYVRASVKNERLRE